MNALLTTAAILLMTLPYVMLLSVPLVKAKAAKPQADVREAVRIRGGEVFDPWGNPVRSGMDRDHDGYIDVEGRKHCTDHVTPPNLDYQVAVVVRTGKPPDGSGGVGAHVGRR